MNNLKILTVIMFTLLLSPALANPEQIVIFEFEYNKGIITLTNQIHDIGYYPDRKIVPENPYNCTLANEDNVQLYDFAFEIPKERIEISTEEGMQGQTIELNKTEFSEIVPYFHTASRIICKNPAGFEILDEKVEKIALSPEQNSGWIIAWILVAVIALIIFMVKNRKSRQ